MSKFCVNCGNEIANGMAFCSGCGAKVETTENTVTKVETNVAQVTTVKEAKEQKVLSPPSKTPSIESSNIEPTGKYGVVSTGYFFGMMLLYAIPVLGWLICLITAFAYKNENKKHCYNLTNDNTFNYIRNKSLCNNRSYKWRYSKIFW